MPERKITKRPLKKYAIGDMRHRITLHTRNITPGNFDNPNFSETYDDGTDFWANVSTISLQANQGVTYFSGVALPAGSSHVFVIRFASEITSENMVRWENRTYKVLAVNNPEERNQYSELFVQLLGDKDLAANT